MKTHLTRLPARLMQVMLILICSFLPARGVEGSFHDLAGHLFAVSNSHINKICQDHLGYI